MHSFEFHLRWLLTVLVVTSVACRETEPGEDYLDHDTDTGSDTGGDTDTDTDTDTDADTDTDTDTDTDADTDTDFDTETGADPLHVWSRLYGGTAPDEDANGLAVAVDSADNVLVTGYFQDTITIGEDVLDAVGSRDVLIAKLDPDGDPLWAVGFGTTGGYMSECIGYSIAVDGDDNILVTGSFQNTVDFGGDPLTAGDDHDVFVLKLTPAGAHLFSLALGATSGGLGSSIAADSSGNVLVAGEFGGTLDAGGDPLVSHGITDAFLVKLDADGNHVWSHHYGGEYVETLFGVPRALAVDGDDNVLLTGQFQGTADFGGDPLSSPVEFGMFIARYDTDGVHQWSQGWGEAGGYGVAVNASGDVWLAGWIGDSADFGGGEVVGPASVLVRYDSSGEYLDHTASGEHLLIHSLAVDTDNAVATVGDYGSETSFGGDEFVLVGENDIFVAAHDADLDHVWSAGYGGGYSTAADVAVDSLGNVIFTGYIDAPVDFGGGDLPAAGPGLIVVKFAP